MWRYKIVPTINLQHYHFVYVKARHIDVSTVKNSYNEKKNKTLRPHYHNGVLVLVRAATGDRLSRAQCAGCASDLPADKNIIEHYSFVFWST